MIIEHTPRTRASQSRQSRLLWPMILVAMVLIGLAGGTILAMRG